MKTAAVLLLGLGLAFNGLAADVPGVNELTETLSLSPWAELPVRVAGLVRHAKTHERKDMTVAAVKAALQLNPAAATAVVGAVARAVPSMAVVAAETAAAAQPKQAPEIARAAAAADHAAAAAIVAAVCRVVPSQYESVAIAVSEAVPGSAKEILQAVAMDQPVLKIPIEQVEAQYNGYLPSVEVVLSQAQPLAANADASYLFPEAMQVNHHGDMAPTLGKLAPRSSGTPPADYKRP